MKNKYLQYSTIIILVFFLFSSCENKNQETEKESGIIEEINAFPILYKHFEREADYINTMAPSVIKPEFVFKQLGDNILLIDIRSNEDFVKGHIKNAVNVKPSNIIEYLWKSAVPSKLDKIIIIDKNGNDAGYIAGILRLLNYRNIYSLKWGMAGWNKSFASPWLKATENDKTDIITNIPDSIGIAGNFPYIKSCESTCIDALEKRSNDLLNKDMSENKISINELMLDPDKYYLIAYLPKEIYDMGHIKGSIQYEPRISLVKDSILNTLPLDKTIVTYCYTGHHTAYLTAYLQLLGYNARNLEYGANSFMSSVMRSRGHATFKGSNYPYVK